jgi:diguanylate cyclase (GGDEF)-like protein
MIGIDQLKQINDSLGTTVGDGLLKSLAVALDDQVRESNLAGMLGVEEEEVTPARISGGEFALIIPNVSRVEIVTQVARGILSMLETPIQVNGREIFVTVNIGISMYPIDGESTEALLERADTAMTGAKERGRNTYQHHSKEHNAKSEERLKLEAHLKKAPLKQELFLSFQPKIEVGTGHVTGAEGSLRWKHSAWGIVPPEKFIPIAEESGLIVPAGEQALYLACALNKQWQDSKIDAIRVSMHVSGREFHNGEKFLVSTRKSLVKTGLAGKFLTLTFDESVLMENPQRNFKTLAGLKDLGVMLAIDHFGTGLSSFGYLRHFPLDELKLDGSLIGSVPENSDGAAIVSAAIDLAHGMGLKVVAAGVETEEQLGFLEKAGCDEYQGRLSSARTLNWQKRARQAARSLSTGYVGDDAADGSAAANEGAGNVGAS